MKPIISVAGALAIATATVGAGLVVFPSIATAQTEAQKSALASVIQATAKSISGSDDAAASARASAVKAAIDTFVANNGIDASVVEALVSGALSLLPANVSSLPGVSAPATSEAQALQTSSSAQTANSTTPSMNSGATQGANPTASGSSGSGGGGGGGGGSSPYGVH